MFGILDLVMLHLIAGMFAQERITIVESATCDGCSVRLERILRIGREDGPGILESERLKGQRDSRGRYYIHTYPRGTEIKVFGPTGAYLTTIGRTGGGPGEFQEISSIFVDQDDRLFIVDLPAQRLTIFNREYEREAATRFEMPASGSGVRLPNGSFVFAAGIRTAERVGLPLHVVENGRIVRSVGGNGVYRPDIPYIDSRALSAAKDRNAFWAAFRNQYVTQLRNEDGEMVLEIDRRASWFPPRFAPRASGVAVRAPDPYIANIVDLGDGLLAYAILVADRDWDETVSGADRHPVVADNYRYRDTLIEVLDYDRRAVVGSVRLPEPTAHFLAGGLVGSVYMDGRGVPYYDVSRLVVVH